MKKEDIQVVLNKEPHLTIEGFGCYIPEHFEQRRKDLLKQSRECTRVCGWLKQVTKIKNINKATNSYFLKHLVELDIGYITNGIFICAAIHMGFKYKVFGMNAFFNISERNIHEIWNRKPDRIVV